MARVVGHRWSLVGKEAAVFRCTYTSIRLYCKSRMRRPFSTRCFAVLLRCVLCVHVLVVYSAHTVPVLLLAVFLPEGTFTACIDCPESLQQCRSRECFTCNHVPASCDVDEDNLTISCAVNTTSCYYETCDECDYCALLFLGSAGSWKFKSLCLRHRCVNFHEDVDNICQRRSTFEDCRFHRNDRNEGFPPSQFLCSCYGENCSSPFLPYIYTHPPTSPPPLDLNFMTPSTSPLGSPTGSPIGSPVVNMPHRKSSHVHFTFCHPHVHVYVYVPDMYIHWSLYIHCTCVLT